MDNQSAKKSGGKTGNETSGALSAMDCQACFLAASHAFLHERTPGAMGALLAAYALWHVAEKGSEAGLDDELERITTQCRNILAGLP